MKLTRQLRAEQWAQRITTQLGKSVEAIIDVGRLLVKAKADLVHGEWIRLFDEQLIPFSRQTAFRLMAVAEHPLLSNVAHAQHLPASWMTLYELTKVEPTVLNNALRDGVITPDMPRKAVSALMPAEADSTADNPAPPFHWLNGVGDLRDAMERVIGSWPDDARALAPQALRELADILEAELHVGRRSRQHASEAGGYLDVEGHVEVAR